MLRRMTQSWLKRWRDGHTGWHEPEGNQNLKNHCTWTNRRVLVPLCGKTPDILWLEARGNSVVGVELSDIAVEAFFAESGLEYELESGALNRYRCTSRDITLYCGDYFEFSEEPFNAHYDRGALIALPPNLRSRYAEHTSALLAQDVQQLVLTVEYDNSVCDGPPFSVEREEVLSYWPQLRQQARVADIENAPPKFLNAGLTSMHEVVWVS